MISLSRPRSRESPTSDFASKATMLATTQTGSAKGMLSPSHAVLEYHRL